MSLITWDSASLKTIVLAASGGLTEAVIGHPLDSIKVRLQTNATKNMLRQLYRGVVPVLLSSPTAWILQFSLYQRSLGIFKSDSLANVGFAGACAGSIWSIIICPFDIVKCYAQRYHVTARTALHDIHSQFGYTGLYRGFTSCLVRDIPIAAVYFTVLEACRRNIPHYSESGFVYPFVTGSLCGVSAWMVGLPGDCIKSIIQTNFASQSMKLEFDKLTQVASRVHNDAKQAEISSSFRTNYSNFVRENGFFGLYRGVLPVVSRSVLTTGCCIVVVEYVNRNLFAS